MRGEHAQAEAMMRAAFATCQAAHQPQDLLNATIMNNLAVLLKQQGQEKYAECEQLYRAALDIRSKVLGESHNDTIVSMHNLAELYTARDGEDAAAATKIREQILALYQDKKDAPTLAPAATATAAALAAAPSVRVDKSTSEPDAAFIVARTSSDNGATADDDDAAAVAAAGGSTNDSAAANKPLSGPSKSSIASSNTKFDPTGR
jgi:hypothetical protein